MLVDYAFPPHPSPAALRAAGATGVSRYLSYATTSAVGKIITPAEYAALLAADLDVVLNWEYDARDYRGGAPAGSSHGQEAVRLAKSLGYPAGCAITGSADTDMSRSDWLTYGKPYYTSFAAKVRGAGFLAGIYGPWDVLQWAHDDDTAEIFWQAGMSTAWSGGRNAHVWPGVHLRQVRQQTIGGADCDVNDILRSEYGQHGGSVMSDADIPDTHRVASNGDRWGLATITGSQPATYLGSDSKEYPTDNVLHRKLDLILAAVAQTVALSDAQMADLVLGVTAAVITTHDKLTEADQPVISAAVLDALRAGTGS